MKPEKLNLTDEQDCLLSKEEELRFKNGTYTPEDVKKLYEYYKQSIQDPVTEFLISIKSVLRKYMYKMDRGQLVIGTDANSKTPTKDEIARRYLLDGEGIAKSLKALKSQGSEISNTPIIVMSEADMVKATHARSINRE